MSSYKVESGDISAIRFAVDDYIEQTQKETRKKHAILQKNIRVSRIINENQLYIDAYETDSEYSEYDDHDEGVWFSDPEDFVDDYY